MEKEAVLWGANALLPREIRISSVDEVDLEFHARRSARSKTYEYRIWRGPVVSPFQCRYVYACRYPLSEEAMDRGAKHFIGTNDFTSFCATATEIEDRIRTIYGAEWDRSGQEWVFRICGNGFLQYMVRTIGGTLLQIGRGRLSVEQLPEIFAAKDRRLAGPSLPAHGLHLMKVEY